MRTRKTVTCLLLAVLLLLSCSLFGPAPSVLPSATATALASATVMASATALATAATPAVLPTSGSASGKIQHIIMIMQENRSFDEYFGTYPGADGIPMQNGVPTVCVPDPSTKKCVAPFHDPNDMNAGGPHSAPFAANDIDQGKMDGFIRSYRQAQTLCKDPTTPGCAWAQTPDVMGWHDAREIPNYWAYAQNYVLQDRMFEPNASWSLPSHLFMVSAWSAKCTTPNDPASCVNALDNPGLSKDMLDVSKNDYAWTDLTYLLHKAKISWAYYLSQGNQPDCADDAMLCDHAPLALNVPGIWNPLPMFDTVRQDGELANIQTVDKFYIAAKNGSLPAVAWIIPEYSVSEHPQSKISVGQAYVTSLVNAVMQGPDWATTAIFISWDDWGGFYDHVVPPAVDANGYGLRVPGLLISPYARKGRIDHQTLSFDAYLKLIEDVFLNGQRLDPKTDGRPDPRPMVRENAAQLGDLLQEFDFNQQPQPALLLPLTPTPGPASIP